MALTTMRLVSKAKVTFYSLKARPECLARRHGLFGTNHAQCKTMRALWSLSPNHCSSKDDSSQPNKTFYKVNHKINVLFNTRRWFETEAEYHHVADITLETIQDAIDEVLDGTSIEYEINLASGVLTFSMPPHGTWVVNKQTPNRQIWWSSPLSGPKRFEYDNDDKLWFSTKDGQNLGREIVQEIRRFYPDVEDFEIHV